MKVRDHPHHRYVAPLFDDLDSIFEKGNISTKFVNDKPFE